MNYYQNKPNQTQFVVSKVEPPVVSLPVLSLSKGSNLFFKNSGFLKGRSVFQDVLCHFGWSAEDFREVVN